MSRIKIIRILIGLNLIIFLLPFFNTCTNTPLRKENKEILDGIAQSKHISKEYKKILIHDEKVRFNDRKRSNDKQVLNAYQLAKMPFQNPKMKMFKEPFFYFSFCFTIQILSIILMFILLWKDKVKTVQLMVLANIAILILSLLIPIYASILEYIDQIKIGFYVYLINLIIIYFMIKKGKRKTKMNVL